MCVCMCTLLCLLRGKPNENCSSFSFSFIKFTLCGVSERVSVNGNGENFIHFMHRHYLVVLIAAGVCHLSLHWFALISFLFSPHQWRTSLVVVVVVSIWISMACGRGRFVNRQRLAIFPAADLRLPFEFLFLHHLRGFLRCNKNFIVC